MNIYNTGNSIFLVRYFRIIQYLCCKPNKISILQNHIMKKIFTLLFAVALFAACNSSGTKTESNNAIDLAAIKTVQLHVTGMTCEGCENTIMTKVNEIDGVTETQASHVDELTTISFDTTQTNIAEISEIINGLGYAVEGEVKPENQLKE